MYTRKNQNSIIMQLIPENSSPEVSVRCSKSDPALSPRQYPRVGTPYPTVRQKQTLPQPPSKIPRLTTENSQNLDLNGSNCHKYLCSNSNVKQPLQLSIKTELYPSPNQLSTTTLHYPREILYTASPQGSYTDLYKFYQPPTPVSPPLVQVYRKNNHHRKPAFSTNFSKYGQQREQHLLKQHYQQIQQKPQPKPAEHKLISCKDYDKFRNSPKVEPIYLSSTNIPNKIKTTRNYGAILDSEGYLQGPHASHNKRIESYGNLIETQRDRSQIHIYKVDQDRGDYNHNHFISNNDTTNNSNKTCYSSGKGLPPLPPKVKNKNDQEFLQYPPRIATATLSQGNTVLEPHSSSYLTNYSSSSRPNSCLVPSTPSFNNNSNRKKYTNDGIKKFTINSTRKLNFSRTSLQLQQSKVHEAESCTNLLLHKKYSEPQFSSYNSNNNCAKCPLCEESKGQCHLHHRTMCSRYMTDLEWRICHAVNIYVYKNGVEGQTPVLVHIPPGKKKNMRSVMTVIQERICYPIGYAKYLYRMNGKKVTTPCELEMYNNYVVASNYDKCFKCVCYARRKSPLLVLAKESKHVRELRLKNYQYELYLAKKRFCDGEGQCGISNESGCGYPDGYIPGQIPIGISLGQSLGQCCGGPACTNRNCGCRKKPKYTMEHTPVPVRSQDPRNSAVNSPFEYVVNNCTISTAPLKDPADFLKKSKKGSDESISVPSSCRYKGLMNDEESLFYSSKKKKAHRGVVDAVGGSKKIFYQKSDGLYPLHDSLGNNTTMHKGQEGGESQSDHSDGSKLSSVTAVRQDATRELFSPIKNKPNSKGNTDSIERTLGKSQIVSVYNINEGNFDRIGKGDEPQENAVKYYPREHNLTNVDKAGEVGGKGEHSWNSQEMKVMEDSSNSSKRAFDDDLEIPSLHILDEGTHLDTTNYITGNQTQKPRNPTPSPNISRTTHADAPNPLISVPSKSYTVLANQNQSSNNNNINNGGHNNYSSPKRHATRVATPIPPRENGGVRHPRMPLKDLNGNVININSSNNNNNCSSNKFVESISQPQYHSKLHVPNQNLSPNVPSMYTVNGTTPIYLTGNQTAYTCFGHTVPHSTNGFFVHSAPTPNLINHHHHRQSHIQQMYPLEILNQRPAYGQFVTDNSSLNCFGYSHNSREMLSDEIDIPFTPPVVYTQQHPQRATKISLNEDQVDFSVGGGSCVQVPSYVNMTTAPALSQQFSYLGDLQGYASPVSNRSLGILAITKPSRRNVAIQMGEPSTTSLENRSPSQVVHAIHTNNNRTSPPVAGSSRPPHPVFYQPHSQSYYSTEPGNSNQQYQNQGVLSQIQNNDHSVLPPPTRYRDGLFDNRPCLSFSKQTNHNNYVRGGGGESRRDDSLCKENSEFYGHVHESKHPRYVWKKS